jgi:UDP:flavonoid glycosyltransferase YjiC (YdhE family)
MQIMQLFPVFFVHSGMPGQPSSSAFNLLKFNQDIEASLNLRYNFDNKEYSDEVYGLNITMVTMGSAGDVRPYIVLGNELKKRGHNITLAAFSSFACMSEEAGLPFFPLSGNAEKFISSIMNPDTNAVTYLPRLYKMLHAIVPDLLRDLEDSCKNADAMVCNYFGSVYYSIAEKLHIPCIQTHFFPMDPTAAIPMSSFRNQNLGPAMNKLTYKFAYYAIGTVEGILLSGWRKKSNITKRKPSTHPVYRIGNHEIPVIYAISPSVFPRPSEWPDNLKMAGFLFDSSSCEWEPPKDLEDFLSIGEKPVYIGFGSMRTGDMNRMLSIILRSLHAAGLRAVISGALIGNNRKSNRKVYFADRYVPHDWLFPRVSAVIHHGGAGTVAAGLRWGCPTWVLPFAGDQPFWGMQVWRIGCGPRPISREKITVQKFTEGLLDLTSHAEYKKRAADIADRLSKENGKSIAADLIESFIREW